MIKTVKIEGMSCQHCVKRIDKALNALKGVQATVSLENKSAELNLKKEIDEKLIRSAIEDLGYKVLEIK
ncbi:MAG TPA: heavy metal transport/detoxification protein [Acholeplasmatales bacterium]|nr:heavy metal transport/detoxification protein [Acholeplasmatales bacterium]